MDWQGEGQGEEGQLVTGSNDKSLRLSRVQLGVVQHEAVVLKGHNGTIRCAAFAPTRGVLASAGSGDLRPRLWRTDTGVCTGLLEAHPDTVHGLCWLDQHTLLSACEGGTLRAHDTRSPATAWSLNAGRGLCCLASAGSLVVAGCVGGWLGMIDPSVQRIVAMEKRHGDDIRAVAVWQHEVAGSSKDFALLTTSFDATCEIVKVSVQQTPSLAVIAKLVGHSDKVLGAKFTSAGNVLTTGADGKALLWKPSSK
jgi:WD40 repeat protein